MSHAVADCINCGENGMHLDDKPKPQRAWGERHVNRYPDHQVFLTIETTRRITKK